MARRRRRLSGPRPPKAVAKPASAKKSKERRDLIEQDKFVDSLDPPNHLVALVPDKKIQSGARRWPFMTLLYDDGNHYAGYFVSKIHGADHWSQWSDHPPTWMDPIAFQKMCMLDPRVQAVLAKAIKSKDSRYAKQLEPLLDEIFEERYLPWVFKRFAFARTIMAEYLLRHGAEIHVDATSKAEWDRYNEQLAAAVKRQPKGKDTPQE